MRINAEEIFKETIGHITGLKEGSSPLGTRKVEKGKNPTRNIITGFFIDILSDQPVSRDQTLGELFKQVRHEFTRYYSKDKNFEFLKNRVDILKHHSDENLKAGAVSEIWAPEIAIKEEEILPKWQLHKVSPNPEPYQPEEIVLQLNSLYSLPKNTPGHLDSSIRVEWERSKKQSDETIFHYDHPVPLFSPDENHELLNCLRELDIEIEFEKEMGVFRNNHKVPVIISVSVTHPRIDQTCGLWLKKILEEKKYLHMQLYIITENTTQDLKKRIGFNSRTANVFSVAGQYANHFNLLKYFQLILEKTHGIRAGFKLDTDEGIRARDLYHATGKTWFQTMCHEYWGGSARGDRDESIYLGVIQGEYINEKDIQSKGYQNCLRTPDVTFNGNYLGPDIFFNKGVAHAKATELYNRKGEKLDDFLSHPVVKGGGFGIDNIALKEYIPFTLSKVGRAEDQQFYMAGLAKGCRGIFTPDLRIAHYKQSRATTESLTEVTRFLGDMFRLVIFNEIVKFLGIKDLIDPMPGVFAGEFARTQAFFSILYKSYIYFVDGEPDKGDFLFKNGLSELKGLIKEIDSGKIKKSWLAEQKDWGDFVAQVDGCSKSKLLDALQKIEV